MPSSLRKDIFEKGFCKNIQYRDAAILAQALVIEPINLVGIINFCNAVVNNSNLCDLTRLVVSSDQGYPVRVTHLDRYQVIS